MVSVDNMAINRHTTEITEPRVYLGDRKANDKVFAILFGLGFLAHFIFSIVVISSANAYVPMRQTLFPETCTSDHGCYFTSVNCTVGLVRVIDNRYIMGELDESPCVNPCKEDYIFLEESHDCVKKSTLDLELVERCHNRWNNPGIRRLEDEKIEEPSFSDVVANAAFIIISLLILIFTISTCWGYFLQKHSVKMVWTTIALELVASLAMTVYLFTESQEAAAANAVFTIIGVAFIYRLRQKVTLSAQLLGEACSALRSHPSVFGYGVLIKLVWILYAFFTFYAAFESFMIQDLVETVYDYDDGTSFSVCNVTQPSWISQSFFFLFSMFGWITSFLHQIRWGTVSGTVCLWFFHTGKHDMPENPTKLALSWATTTSVGTHAFSALIIQILRRLRRLCKFLLPYFIN